jgi:hypothetical protein
MERIATKRQQQGLPSSFHEQKENVKVQRHH